MTERLLEQSRKLKQQADRLIAHSGRIATKSQGETIKAEKTMTEH